MFSENLKLKSSLTFICLKEILPIFLSISKRNLIAFTFEVLTIATTITSKKTTKIYKKIKSLIWTEKKN